MSTITKTSCTSPCRSGQPRAQSIRSPKRTRRCEVVWVGYSCRDRSAVLLEDLREFGDYVVAVVGVFDGELRFSLGKTEVEKYFTFIITQKYLCRSPIAGWRVTERIIC